MIEMVVTCGSCGARFLMKQALFQDAKGARIRCRRCGERIEVWNPAVPAVSAATEAEPEIVPAATPEPVAETPPEPDVEVPPALVAEALSVPVAEPDIEPGPITEAEIEPVVEPAPGPVAAIHEPAEVEAPVEVQPTVPAFDLRDAVPYAAAEPGLSREVREADLAALKMRFRASRRRGPSRVAILLVVVVILLLAGGAFFFRDTMHFRELAGRFSPPPESAKTTSPASPVSPASVEEKPAYDIREVDSSYVKTFDGEDRFVIQGTVANVGKGPSRGIRIHAALLGKDNQALASNSVFAGNLVDNTMLRHANREAIEGFLGVRQGERNANRDIPVGASRPFMAVFFDPPGQFESYTVKALDAE